MSLPLASLEPILSDVGVAILAAAALAFVARALGQPLILAYVAAGVLLGGNVGFGVITEPESIRVISNLGLILLLFLIGLEIDVTALRRAGKAVLWAGLLQVPLNALLCAAVPVAIEMLGATDALGRYGALYLAFGLSLSSTLVVVKLLYDKHEIDTTPGRITLGVLVVQDLWAILFLAVQPSFASPQLLPLLLSLGQGAILVVGAFVVSRYLLPHLFRSAAKTPELILLGALAWCFLIAGIASKVKLSAEMGALIAGLSLSVLPYKPDVVAKVTSVRDFFLTLFFVALGLLVTRPTPALAVTSLVVAAFVLVTRCVILFPLLRRLGLGNRVSFLVPLNLWPVSEFALVLTAIGFHSGHVTETVLQLILFVTIVSAVAGTYAILGSHGLQRRVVAWLARRGWGDRTTQASGILPRPRSVALLGFHRTASALLAAIQANHPTLLPDILVVDFNPVVLEGLHSRGVAAAYGDLANPDTLHHAGIHGAKIVVSTLPDTLLKGTTNLRLLQVVHSILPEAKVIVTAETAHAEKTLYDAGAAAVIVAPRAASEATLTDLIALLDGKPSPSRERASSQGDEVMR